MAKIQLWEMERFELSAPLRATGSKLSVKPLDNTPSKSKKRITKWVATSPKKLTVALPVTLLFQSDLKQMCA